MENYFASKKHLMTIKHFRVLFLNISIKMNDFIYIKLYKYKIKNDIKLYLYNIKCMCIYG